MRHLAPPPSTPVGEARLASGDDLELLVNWNAGFAADTDVAPLPDPAGHLSAQVQTNSAWVWEQYGVPSAMARRLGFEAISESTFYEFLA